MSDKSLFDFLAERWKNWGNPNIKLERRKKRLESLKKELELEKDIKALEDQIEQLKK